MGSPYYTILYNLKQNETKRNARRTILMYDHKENITVFKSKS